MPIPVNRLTPRQYLVLNLERMQLTTKIDRVASEMFSIMKFFSYLFSDYSRITPSPRICGAPHNELIPRGPLRTKAFK
jgi:hypothetical protein